MALAQASLLCNGDSTRPKRTKFTAEEVLVQMEKENEFDSDHGGVSSGKKSDIDRQLMDYDEESR